MPRPIPKISKSDISKAIRIMERLINEGWAIQYARKKACGGDGSTLAKEVKKSPSYLVLLNHYMKRKNNKYGFKREQNGKLVANTKG